MRNVTKFYVFNIKHIWRSVRLSLYYVWWVEITCLRMIRIRIFQEYLIWGICGVCVSRIWYKDLKDSYKMSLKSFFINQMLIVDFAPHLRYLLRYCTSNEDWRLKRLLQTIFQVFCRQSTFDCWLCSSSEVLDKALYLRWGI